MASHISGVVPPSEIYAANVAATKGLEVKETPNAAASFANIFNSFVSQANEQYETAEQGTQALLTGESDNLAQVMIDSAKAETSLNMVIQIRNKVLDAYNEVMRMSL